MHPLEAMATADAKDRYGEDCFSKMDAESKHFCVERMKKCLLALEEAELSATSKRAGSPFRFGGEETGEASFRAILRQIVEEGR